MKKGHKIDQYFRAVPDKIRNQLSQCHRRSKEAYIIVFQMS